MLGACKCNYYRKISIRADMFLSNSICMLVYPLRSRNRWTKRTTTFLEALFWFWTGFSPYSLVGIYQLYKKKQSKIYFRPPSPYQNIFFTLYYKKSRMRGGERGGEGGYHEKSYLGKMLFLFLMYTHKSFLLIWFKSLRILNVKLDIGKRRQRYAYTEGILQLYKNCIASSFLSLMRPNALFFSVCWFLTVLLLRKLERK